MFTYTPAASLVVTKPTSPARPASPFPSVTSSLASYSVVAGTRVPNERPPVYIDVIVANRPFSALIDSGAAVSCATPTLVRSLARKGRCMIQPANIAVTAYNGKETQLEEQTELSFSIGSAAFRQRFYMVTNLPADLLLGCDFLHNSRALVDFAQGAVRLFDGKEEVFSEFRTSPPHTSSQSGPLGRPYGEHPASKQSRPPRTATRSSERAPCPPSSVGRYCP